MILRRVIEHVRKQEWTAIFIDFVIVVAGVFVGIQVSNWNAARELRASEKSQLTQLGEEIQTSLQLIDSLQTYTETSVETGTRALEFLEGDGDCRDRCAGLLIDFFHASQVWGTPFPRGKFEENTRLGFPSDEAARRAVELFYINLIGWTPINLSPPPFRTTIRGYFSPAAARTLWGDCFIVPASQLEEMRRDCESQIDATAAAAMLRAIHADGTIANELRFWVGQNVFALDEFGNTRRAGEDALKALGVKSGAAP